MKYFTRSRREPNGAEYTHCKLSAPEWVHEVCCQAHQGMTLNDWVYATLAAAFECAEPGKDWIDDFANDQVEVYTQPLFQWATDFCLTALFATAEEDMVAIYDTGATLAETMGWLQHAAICRIAQLVNDAVEKNT